MVTTVIAITIALLVLEIRASYAAMIENTRRAMIFTKNKEFEIRNFWSSIEVQLHRLCDGDGMVTTVIAITIALLV